jgi:hypothetical protein
VTAGSASRLTNLAVFDEAAKVPREFPRWHRCQGHPQEAAARGCGSRLTLYRSFIRELRDVLSEYISPLFSSRWLEYYFYYV